MNFYVLHEQNYRVKLHKFPQEKLIFDQAVGGWLQTSRNKSNYLFLRKERKVFLQIYGSFGFILWPGRTKSAISLKLWNGYDLNHRQECCCDSPMRTLHTLLCLMLICCVTLICFIKPFLQIQIHFNGLKSGRLGYQWLQTDRNMFFNQSRCTYLPSPLSPPLNNKKNKKILYCVNLN